jgi:hypothetical protein
MFPPVSHTMPAEFSPIASHQFHACRNTAAK